MVCLPTAILSRHSVMEHNGMKQTCPPRWESGKIHIDVFIIPFLFTRLFSREKRDQSDGLFGFAHGPDSSYAFVVSNEAIRFGIGVLHRIDKVFLRFIKYYNTNDE